MTIKNWEKNNGIVNVPLFQKGNWLLVEKKILYDTKTKRTSGLAYHLKSCHGIKINYSDEKKQSTLHFETSSSKIVNNSLIKIAATTSTNSSIVNNGFFKEMIEGLNSFLPDDNQIELKDSNYYQNSIPFVAKEMKQKLKEELISIFKSNQIIFPSVATDEGKTNGTKYYSIILYFIDESFIFHEYLLDYYIVDGNQSAINVKNQVESNMAFYQIPKIHYLISDGASYNKSAAESLNATHIHCLPHVFNLIINDLFDNDISFQSILIKLNQIRNHFIRSSCDWEELNSFCEIKITLKSYSKTRFNSSFNVFLSFLLKFDGFVKYNDNLIKKEEWIEIYKFYCVIKIINDYIVFYSSTKKITRDSIVFMLKKFEEKIKNTKNYLSGCNNSKIFENITLLRTNYVLKNKNYNNTKYTFIEENEEYEDFVSATFIENRGSDFWNILFKSIKDRLFIFRDNIENIVSLYLSPLYRKLFMNEEERIRVRKFWNRYLDKYDCNFNDLQNNIIQNIPFNNYFENEIHSFILKIGNDSECDRFEEDTSLETAELFWTKRENQLKYPRLFIFARKYLHVPSSSIEVERVFSVANSFINQRNTRTSPKVLSSRVFIKKCKK